MERLHIGLDRFVGEQRRTVAAAFQKSDARHHPIARKRIEIEYQRLLDQAVDEKFVLAGIDVGNAGVHDGEVQAVGRDGALEQMMGRPRARAARLVLRIIDGADHTLFERRRMPVGRRRVARLEAPRRLGQRFGRGAGHGSRGARAHRSSHHDATAEERTTVKQAVSGHLSDGTPVSS
jgi:hypothetical protein